MNRLQIGFTLALSISMFMLSTGSATASHPYHVSLAEIEWNQSTQKFEVALCVWPADLETAISKQVGHFVNLDQCENLDELCQAYVTARMTIINSGSDQKENQIRWVGSEVGLKKAWLYFEIAGDPKAQSFEIKNSLFFELNEEQLNLVRIKTGTTYNSEQLTHDNSSFEFKLESAEK